MRGQITDLVPDHITKTGPHGAAASEYTVGADFKTMNVRLEKILNEPVWRWQIVNSEPKAAQLFDI